VLRLLFDQHAGGEIYERLSSSDAFDIELIRNIDSLGPRAGDTEIWRYAVENNRVVLTNDQHFIDGTADPGDGTHPGVILYENYDWAAIDEAIERIEAVMNTEQMAENRVEFHVPTGWID
jgi:predicted nuclease of predicted toxin-antitoxin system